MVDQFLQFSDELAAKLRKQLERRFSERTAQGCQVRPGWGKKSPTITVQGQTYGAHRVSFAVWKTPVPVRWQVRHLCENVQCVNPSHLVLSNHGQDVELRQTTVVEAMAFPISVSRPPSRELLKMAFPADYPEE